MFQFDYSRGRLTTKITGNYHAAAPLANVTIAGVSRKPQRVSFQMRRHQVSNVKSQYVNETLYVTGLEQYTQGGAWENEFSLQMM